jgi:hypothetical protein
MITERDGPLRIWMTKPTDDLEVSLLLPAACVYSRLALCSCCSQYCLSITNNNKNYKVSGRGAAKWRCSVVKSGGVT